MKKAGKGTKWPKNGYDPSLCKELAECHTVDIPRGQGGKITGMTENPVIQ